MPVLSSLVILVTTGILLLGKYRLLDSLSEKLYHDCFNGNHRGRCRDCFYA